MRTSAESLEGNMVKLLVEIDEEEIVRAEEEALRRLTLEARLPGFRPGRVPSKIVKARLGTKGLREEVLRESLPEYLSDAVTAEALDVIAAPDIDITSGEDGGPVAFSAVVEVRPEVSIGGYEGLVVTVPRLEATPEELEVQLDKMRDQFATLTEVGRPAVTGDLVTLSVHGTRDGEPAEGLSADDLVYEVGKGGIADGMDERLVGAKAGDVFEMDAEDTPDGPAHLHTLVKLVREKVLPAADDAFAADASEFETIAELRADLAKRIGNARHVQASIELRDHAIDALIALVADDPPPTLVEEETNRVTREFVLRLAEQQIRLEDYLRVFGQDMDTFLGEFKNQAVNGAKADLALRALAREESLEPDESDFDEAIVHLASHADQSPAEFRELIERNGRMPELRADLLKSKAMTWLTDHVAIVDEDGNPVDREALRPAELDHDHEGLHDSDAEQNEPSPDRGAVS